METKSLKLTFQAPIILDYQFEIDLDDIEDGDINKFIASALLEQMEYAADSMYHHYKDDLAWHIKKNIALVKAEKQCKRAGDFTF